MGKIKLYKYNFGWGSYEDSDYTQLQHQNKYTQDEFEAIIKEAIINYANIKLIEWDEEIEPFYRHMLSYEHHHDYIVNILCDQYGFERITFEAAVSLNGWNSIFDTNINYNPEYHDLHHEIAQKIHSQNEEILKRVLDAERERDRLVHKEYLANKAKVKEDIKAILSMTDEMD